MLSKSYFIFILFIFSVKAYCQDYHPLPIENVIWQEYEYESYNPCVVTTWLIYYTEGDIVLSGFNYKKVFYESNEISYCTHGPGIPFEDITLKTYAGAIRQDTASQKVFIMLKDSTSEKLLYDFSLEKDDTLHFTEYSSSYAIIDSVDSVLVNGTYRKRMLYFLSYPYEAIYRESAVIEGIGDNRGIIFHLCIPSYGYKDITCVSVDGNSIFGTGAACCQPGDICGTILPPPGLNFDISYQLQVSNNFNDHYLTIHVTGASYHPMKIIMRNSLGQIVMSRSVLSNESFVVSHLNFSAGIYYFSLIDGDVVYDTERILWP